MKRIFGLLNLLLCLELIVGPFAPQYSFLLPNKAQAQETSCPAGTSFDTTLNRCITTEETAVIMNAVASCAPQDKACYKANADAALKKAEEENQIEEQIKNKGGLMGTPMKAAAVAVPLFMVAQNLFKGKNSKGQKCGSLSQYMMLGAGAAIFIGDTWANSKHKKRLKKIKEEWEGIRKGEKSGDKGSGENDAEVSTASLAETSTDPDVRKAEAKESQSEAFEMLAKSEDSLASAAKFKSGIYGVGALAFAASSVMSLMEHFKLQSLKAAMIKAQATPGFPAAKEAYVTQYQKSYCTNSIPKATDDPSDKHKQFLEEQEDKEAAAAATTSFMSPAFNSNTINSYRSSILKTQDIASLITLYEGFESSFKRKASPSIDEYNNNKELFSHSGIENSDDILTLAKMFSVKLLDELIPISSALAQDEAAVVGTGDAGSDIVVTANRMTPTPSGLNKALRAPLTRAAIAGVFAVWSGVMTMHARKQASVSKARAKFLRDMKDTFNDATGAISCTQQDRGNPNNLRCYCYNSSGQRDPNKTNSQACSKLFTGKTLNGPSDYLAGLGGVASQKVCLTNNGIDENCSCRQTNSCLSAVPANMQGFNPGSLSLVSSGLTPLDQVSSGQLAAGSIDGASAVNKAGKILDAAKKMAGQDVQTAKDMDKAAKDGAASLMASTQGGFAPSLSSPSSENPFNMSPTQAAAQLEKELDTADKSNINTARTSGTFAQPGSQGDNLDQLEFGMTSGQLAADQAALVEMNKNLNYGNNDINSGSDTNIFEVLSNRYQRSGLRRLFDDEGKTPADPASNSDINP